MQIKMTYLQVGLVGLIIVLLGVSFNLVKRNKSLSGVKQPVADQVAPDEVVEIKVTARQWQFDPNPIRVKLGQQVRLRITSQDVTHGISIPEFGINEILPPGQEVVVNFKANKKGTFDLFCSVACGEGHAGMRGSLVVE